MSERADVIRGVLRLNGDPARAAGQQAYMKSEMPFLGVRLPEVRTLTKPLIADADAAELHDLARELWDEAAHREERYAALFALAGKSLRGDPVVVPLIEHMVSTGQWWDYTDELAHRIAALHDAHPAETAELVRTWSVDADMWLRRSAIISQLGRRDRLDRLLLSEVIEPNLADREFFIRKAIGWALREYARVDPEWVRGYVERHELSPLSRREALKHL
jgi:3-methyladenine DNA glycosylase AlkD